jgi:hypothetical protein
MTRFKSFALFTALFLSFSLIFVHCLAAGEKVKGTATSVRTKWHPIKVDDEEGHIIAVFENTNVYSKKIDGGFPTGISKGIVDMNVKTGKGTTISYVVVTYPNGDKLYTKAEGKLIGKGQAEGTAVYVGGTGNWEGVKGSTVWKSKSLSPGISFIEIEGEREIPAK